MTNALTPMAENVAENLISLTAPKTLEETGSVVLGFIEELVEAIVAKGGSIRLADVVDELGTYALVCDRSAPVVRE